MQDDIYENMTFQVTEDRSGGRSPLKRFTSVERESAAMEEREEMETIHQILRQAQERKNTEGSVESYGELQTHCGLITDAYQTCYVNGK